MAIVREFDLGSTHIKIDDSEIKNQTKEEAREIWREVSDIAYQILLSQHIAKKKSSDSPGGAGNSSGTKNKEEN